MRHRKAFLGTLGLIMLSLVMTGCFGLFGPKVGNVSGTVKWDDGTVVEGATVKVADKTAKTGKDGKYSLTGIKHGEQDMTVTATFDGKTVEHKQKVTIGKTPLVANIELQKPEVPEPEKEGVISGVVEYETEGPVSGAEVAVKGEDVKATTNDKGEYELAALEHGAYVLVVTLEGRELATHNVTVNDDAVTANITVPDPVAEPSVGDITGTVQDQDANPIEGATVAIAGNGKETETDTDGKFTLSDIEYGKYTLVVTIGDEEAATEEVVLDEEFEPVTIVVSLEDDEPAEPDVGVLSGEVKYDNGDPIVGAKVLAEGEDGIEDTTDAQGKYTLPALEYGEYTISVVFEDELLGSKSVTLAAETQTVDFEFTAPEEPVVGFCDETPDFAAGMTLAVCEDFARSSNFADYQFVPTDARGTWSIVEDSGKHWLKGELSSGWENIYREIPEMASAEKLIVEYTHKPLVGGTHALIFKATDTTNQGRDSYFSYNQAGFYAFRIMKNNNHDPSGENRTYQDNSIKAELGIARQVRLVMEDSTMEVYIDGTRLTGAFPVDLGEYVYVGEEHKYLGMHLNSSTALWTNLRVWTE